MAKYWDLFKKNSDPESKESYAIGVTYASSLSISALSVNDLTLNSIGIKKGLPEDESQALVYLYMAASTLDRDSYLGLLNRFHQPISRESGRVSAPCYLLHKFR